jgi:TetR/AcrR family transcriptional regulator, regulator of cefoperazone and chloramphenicol sensitivity
MAPRTYSVSNDTKNSIMNAAGELFMELGIHAVTTRMIARQAGENLGSIHYHFGGKDGLIKEMVNVALEPWERNDLNQLLEEGKEDLKTPQGQARVLKHLILTYCDSCHFSEKPPWCTNLIHQILISDSELQEHILAKAIIPTNQAFSKLYRIVKPDATVEETVVWHLQIAAPLVQVALTGGVVKALRGGIEVDQVFIDVLKAQVLKGALLMLGLKEVED